MKNVTNKSEDDILKDLLSDLPTETGAEVKLPSKGLFYSDKVDSVQIEPLNFESTKNLLSLKNNKEAAVNHILRLCVKGLDYRQICSIDKLFLLVKIREASYGDDVYVDSMCQNCETMNKLDVKLSELTINYVPEDEEELREFTLPVLKRKVKVRVPRIKDEEYIKSPKEFMENLWRFIHSIEGHSKSTIITSVINKLGIKDINALTSAIVREEYGINTNIKYECDECGKVNIVGLPLDESFFTMR